jgi:hypothetical protein
VWRIPNFSKIKERRVYSEVFSIVGQKWKLVVYPRGSKGDDNRTFSVVLQVSTLLILPHISVMLS